MEALEAFNKSSGLYIGILSLVIGIGGLFFLTKHATGVLEHGFSLFMSYIGIKVFANYYPAVLDISTQFLLVGWKIGKKILSNLVKNTVQLLIG